MDRSFAVRHLLHPGKLDPVLACAMKGIETIRVEATDLKPGDLIEWGNEVPDEVISATTIHAYSLVVRQDAPSVPVYMVELVTARFSLDATKMAANTTWEVPDRAFTVTRLATSA